MSIYQLGDNIPTIPVSAYVAPEATIIGRVILGENVSVWPGVVIRGETPHFDFVAGETAAALARVATETLVPGGFGLLTCDTEQQALDRAGLSGSPEDKGAEAAVAALTTALALRTLPPG